MPATVMHPGPRRSLTFSAALLGTAALMLISLARTPLPPTSAHRASRGLSIRPAAGVAVAQMREPLIAPQALAHVLHDYPMQDIYAALFLLEAQPLPSPESVSQLRATLSRAAAQLRCICAGRHPAEYRSPCLVSALRNLVSTYQLAQGGPAIELTVSGLSSFTLPAAEDLFAIANGALVNALRHSHAQRIEVTLAVAGAHLTLAVNDDGVGFVLPTDPAALIGHGRYGLAHMAERARALGAGLRLDTTLGQGTCVCVVLPLAT